MGNFCLTDKKAQDPDKSAGIVQPPTGMLAGKDAKHGRLAGLLTQQKNLFLVLNRQRGKRGIDASHGYVPSPTDWNVLKVDKHTYLQICKLKCFSYKVLKDATRNFSKKNLIGQGGSGDVYKGYLTDCRMDAATKPNQEFPIAVKTIRRPGAQGCEEWQNELRYLSSISHPNVVNLIGYCCEDKHKLLVYEYMNGGSLEDHLLAEDSSTKLNWTRRIKIAVGAARGLYFLHAYGRPVIHRDIKSSNVLLDAYFNPKLSDFGLARYGPEGDQSHVSSRILGTRGYFAPEYMTTGHLSLKADVYSFGVVLLQILSGCGAIRKCSDGMIGNLTQWAEPHLSNIQELHRVIDKRLRHKFQLKEAGEFAEITHCCLCSDPKERPTMAQVVDCLEKLEQKLGSHDKAHMVQVESIG